ncbi:MAG TPA: hypothetical protein PKY59_21885 [Pyrinomonadaceae bacterium]|nr:hypothetical protein [Pyrinomonadaceae bacterium]
MNRVKTLILFIFLSAFAFQVSAQNDKQILVWKNLQERYERFEDIKPQILNVSNSSVYFDTYFFPYADFEVFDKKSGLWKISQVWHCGTGYKPQIRKIKTTEQFSINFGSEALNEITTIDSVGTPKFRKLPDYDGSGKYRLKFTFGIKKSDFNQLVSYSPEFEVIEKDFTK